MDVILNYLRLTQWEREAFRSAAPNAQHLFRPVPSQVGIAYTATAEELARATIIIGCPPPQAMKDCKSLKWLQTWTAGVDPYLAPGILPEGVILTSAVGSYGHAVSEHMLATILSLMKRLPALRDAQTAHRWDWDQVERVQTIRDATVLLLGVGDIGSHFAQKAKALGARTVGLSRRPEKAVEGVDELYPFAQLDRWLPQADVVAMSLPSTPETYHLMDSRRLGLMKENAILVNAGRGDGVDCAALAEVLKADRLWGAALDVTDPEPLPEDHPLWDCPNLLLTPHTGGGDRMDATTRRVAAIALDNLKRYLAGEALQNRMN